MDRIANEFVDGYYAHYPEEVYEIGYPNSPWTALAIRVRRQPQLGTLRSTTGWQHSNAIDLDRVTDTNTALTYVFAREKMQSMVDRRICQTELWNISPTWTGWQFMFSSTLAVQPVDTRRRARRGACAARGHRPLLGDRDQ